MSSAAPPAPAEARALAAVPLGSLLGGEVDAEAGAGAIAIEDPATEQILASLPDADERVALRALDAACAAQNAWAATTAASRRDLLLRLRGAIADHAEELAHLITAEMGKPLAESRAEVRYAADFVSWFAAEATRVAGRYSDHPEGGGRVLTRKHPIGPCLLITPWNFPLAMAARKLAPALAAGCSAVVKPAEQAPLSTLFLLRLLSECGLPPGVVNAFTTSRPGPVVAALLADGRLRKLSFTGSTEVGRRLLAACADGVVRTSMELGGNAPLLVFDDADLDLAVEGALLAKIRNGGESCTAANRIYVQAGIHDRFVAAFSDRLDALRVGRGTEEVDLGPLIDRPALTRMGELVDDALSGGASVAAGGGTISRSGHFFEPTLVVGPRPDARLLREEIFGPLVAAVRFEREEEALAAANRSEHGLVAYLFTRDLDRALRVADQLDTGMVGINQGVVSNAAAPFGGIKQSGMGREGGPEGLDEYLTLKYLALAGSPRPPLMMLEGAGA